MNSRNKTLQMKIMKLTKAVIGLINNDMKNRQYPQRWYEKFKFTESGFKTFSELKIDFGLMLVDFRDEILQLSEFIECAKYMVKNPVIKGSYKVVDKDGNPVEKVPLSIVLSITLSPFLLAYFNIVNSVTFNEKIFRDTYLRFEKPLYSKIDQFNLTSPLENFSSSINEIDLGKGIRIRRISDAEKSDYLRHLSMGIGHSPLSVAVSNINHVLETTYYHRKGTSINTSDCRRSFEDVITALRLFKSGVVDFNVLRCKPMFWKPPFGISYGAHGAYISPRGPKYILNEWEVKPFKRFWKRYRKRSKTKSNKYLDVALRRFNLGIEETDFEDKMIDYLISFEALYLQERRELTYRLSNRVAILLGKEEKETEEIKQTIKKAYDLRSVIVHGKDFRPIKIEGKTIQTRDFAFIIENYLRKSIRLFIELSKNYKKQEAIIKELDKSLLNTKIRKKLHRLTKLAWFSQK